jgi:cyclopropane fatty-acyl-phospholipid synthase-like methyltransferase
MMGADEQGSDRARDERMSRRWESLAREDAEFYIWTPLADGDDFRASGERDAARIWSQAEPHVRQRRRVLEIGCGVGRILLPMRRMFDAAVGVDIAPTMLAKLGENARAAGLGEVDGALAHERWEERGPFDLVYSHIVLQHIERWSIIADYFARVSRCLDPEGLFYAHFDTRPRTLAYRLRNHLPERLLPRTMQRGVRRIRRSPDDIRMLATESGFSVLSESGAGTSDTVFLLRRA